MECRCSLQKEVYEHNLTDWNFTEWSTKGLYTHEGDKWFYETPEPIFDDGDLLSIVTFFHYSEPYVSQNVTDVIYVPRMAIKTACIDIHIPDNGTEPYFVWFSKY